ncbi:MAG: glucokinase [Myxococcales bacterium]|nr:glucokinase [Myxococcales bacterium]
MAANKQRGQQYIVGDVGGTRARFRLIDAGGHTLREQALESRAYPTFEGVLRAFWTAAGRPRVAAASFGIAGPVIDQRCKTTNLPWHLDARRIARAFDIPRVTLLNDLVAAGLGAIGVPARKIAVLRHGRPKPRGGNIAVIAAGTGLGEALLVWDGERHVPCATEGSHVDFAPRSKLEIELLEHMWKVHRGRVSYERVGSGGTIGALYDFLVRVKGMRETRAVGAHLAEAPDRNAAVVELGESGKSPAAAKALDLFAGIYGAEAGNLALKGLATSGVYICGGVSARLVSLLRGKAFTEAFLDKGRMRAIVEPLPVAVVLEPLAGLLGATSDALGRRI